MNEAVPFFVLADPEFHAAVRDGDPVSVTPETGVVTVAGKGYRAEPVSKIAYQIQAVGGIVPAVQKHGKETFNVLTTAAHVG